MTVNESKERVKMLYLIEKGWASNLGFDLWTKPELGESVVFTIDSAWEYQWVTLDKKKKEEWPPSKMH